MALAAMSLAGAATLAGPLLAQPSAPQAASTAAPVDDKTDAARVAHGRDIFTSWGCTSCHALADAHSSGDVGPHLDGDGLTEAFIVSRVTNGQGAMPAFGGQLTEQEIADLAHYIVTVAKK